MERTEGTLLGGRVRYAQPREGFRTGIEPVLLAASVPARPGARVLEAGTGAGAGLLCLAARVPGVIGTGVEIDPAMAALARANLEANGLSAGLTILEADIVGLAVAGGFDHAFANPPWHDPAGTAPAIPGRSRAKRAAAGLLDAWIGALARQLRPRGTLGLALPVAALPAAIAALAGARCGSIAILPLWPRAGQAARLMLIRAVAGGRGACHVLPGLALHTGPGEPPGFTPEAETILRHGGALNL